MNWKYKAIIQQILSIIPLGADLNYFFQKHITKSLPISDEETVAFVEDGISHLNTFKKYYKGLINKARFYEFGAGVDIIIPMTFYAFGVNSQTVIDIRPLLRIGLVNNTIRQLQKLSRKYSFDRLPQRLLKEGEKNKAVEQLYEWYGIRYLSPCDARNTGLKEGSINFITSTNTLEHIFPQDIHDILLECYRLLTDDGLMSFKIDYRDHYAYFDQSITVYNFLKYSNTMWKIFNPSLHYQNRLRHKDYLNLIESAKFTILEEHFSKVTENDMKKIKEIHLATIFKERYRLNELVLQYSHIILKKKKYSYNKLPNYY